MKALSYIGGLGFLIGICSGGSDTPLIPLVILVASCAALAIGVIYGKETEDVEYF